MDRILQSDWEPIGRDQYQSWPIERPDVEQEMLSDVGSYGRQIGRIGDVLIVLLAHFHPQSPLTQEETAAIAALKKMLNEVADVKQKHGRPALRPHAVTA